MLKTLRFLLLISGTASFYQISFFRTTINRQCRLAAANERSSHPSAAGQERRDEEKRRRDRSQEVVVGKTSALPGEQDHALDISATEEEWLRQATSTEQVVFTQTELGMEKLKMLNMEDANAAFEKVFSLKPDAYLWQAGITKYYLGDLDGAAEIFSRCAAWYESKFDEPATEERIWRHACVLKKFSVLSRAERKAINESPSLDYMNALVAQIPISAQSEALDHLERRKVLKITNELFGSSVQRDFVGEILARAKLRSIGGSIDGRPVLDRKMWKITSWFYLGLHFDAIGEHEESKRCMKTALSLSPNSNSDDIIHILPTLHMTYRDWFDDDQVESGVLSGDSDLATAVFDGAPEHLDPLLIASIRSSLLKLRLVDLQKEVRLRGASVFGSKKELQERLFGLLMIDARLMP